MKIRGVLDDFPQFVVHKPTLQLQTAFKERKSMFGSRLMFHGTPLLNIQLILQGGFKAGEDGHFWAAKEPLVSVSFALKGERAAGRIGALKVGGYGAMVAAGIGQKFGASRDPSKIEKLAQSPYYMYGAILGCEYVEDSRFREPWLALSPQRREARRAREEMMKSTSDPERVMVRYVFLIPPGATNAGNMSRALGGWGIGQMNGPTFPGRSQIEMQMIQNMETIEARIEGRRCLP
jgi:hypothetical protein